MRTGLKGFLSSCTILPAHCIEIARTVCFTLNRGMRRKPGAKCFEQLQEGMIGIPD